jgi:hypothetical protein
MAPPFPTVENEGIEAWELVEETVERLFQLPAMTVEGASRRYEDRETARLLAERTEPPFETTVRFFAATRLGFDPGLPPGTLPSVVLPSVQGESRRAFRERLRERGLRSVARGRSERLRVGGSRVRVHRYDGTVPVEGRDDLPVEGWIGAWHDDGFYVVTGGHPGRRLADAFDLADPPDRLTVPPRGYREEFFDLLRSVR